MRQRTTGEQDAGHRRDRRPDALQLDLPDLLGRPVTSGGLTVSPCLRAGCLQGRPVARLLQQNPDDVVLEGQPLVVLAVEGAIAPSVTSLGPGPGEGQEGVVEPLAAPRGQPFAVPVRVESNVPELGLASHDRSDGVPSLVPGRKLPLTRHERARQTAEPSGSPARRAMSEAISSRS